MGSLVIPKVTEEDLLSFHLQTYGKPFVATTAQSNELWEGEDHGLGRYADGAKRTLTDEQIKIFRHSEIHALLQSHRNAAGATDQVQPTNEDTARDSFRKEGNLAASLPADGVGSSDQSMDEEAEDDEDEYAQFLERERQEFEAAAAARRRNQHAVASAIKDRTISTRRKVREMDAVQDVDQALDYGDTPSSNNAPAPTVRQPSPEAQASTIEGRKIWWPAIAL